MRCAPRFWTAVVVGPLGLFVTLAVWRPTPAAAQATTLSPADSTALVKEAHKRQSDFEYLRAHQIPLTAAPMGRCQALIGRICVWFGGSEEEDFPPESEVTANARTALIQFLSTAAHEIRDPWITGQLVRYLVQDGESLEAEHVARDCDLTERWWCDALLGYVLNIQGSFIRSEDAFRMAIDSMPSAERVKWTTPGYVLTEKGDEIFAKAAPARRDSLWALFWRLSNPLYLVPGNDRLTEHYTRLVQVDMDEDAANSQGVKWQDDMAEALIRYGRTIGLSRSREGPLSMNLQQNMNDRRTVIWHQSPGSRGFLFPERFLKAPSEIPPESWITAPRKAWTWYAPPYAPSFHELDTQVGKFRRGDSMLVVAAYKPTNPPPPPQEKRERPRVQFGTPGMFNNPFAQDRGRPRRERARPDTVRAKPLVFANPVETGLFLVPMNGGRLMSAQGSEPRGVLTLKAPEGRYVSSVEVFDPSGKRAWRARQGVVQDSLVPGVPAVSDMLILKPGAPLPTSLEKAIPYVRPDVDIPRGQRFVVIWEVYGLQVAQPIGVTIGFTRGRPGFLQRVGRFMGILKPASPVNVTFHETTPSNVQTAFRAVSLQLPDLKPGPYTLHLRLDLKGREPITTSRPIMVVAGS